MGIPLKEAIGAGLSRGHSISHSHISHSQVNVSNQFKHGRALPYRETPFTVPKRKPGIAALSKATLSGSHGRFVALQRFARLLHTRQSGPQTSAFQNERNKYRLNHLEKLTSRLYLVGLSSDPPLKVNNFSWVRWNRFPSKPAGGVGGGSTISILTHTHTKILFQAVFSSLINMAQPKRVLGSSSDFPTNIPAIIKPIPEERPTFLGRVGPLASPSPLGSSPRSSSPAAAALWHRRPPERQAPA